ncbi:MAG TPA: HU family DNA-binding protein [Firmicutes bacterium]|jgi:DNA-binding protein HU-beta|nr:HU family DNA-binding protein [Bacillota bacterium]
MTKTELIDQVAEKSGLTKKESGKAVDAIMAAMTEALAGGEKVQLVGFGSFEVRERGARTGRNPQTGEAITIEARKVPVFKPGKALKDAVAK